MARSSNAFGVSNDLDLDGFVINANFLWNNETAYSVGSIVVDGGSLWRALEVADGDDDRPSSASSLWEQVSGGGDGTDNRTNMEIVRAAISQSDTTRTTEFVNGLPRTFTYTLANGQTIIATFLFVSGLPRRVTFRGDFIGETTGVAGMVLVHTFTFENGLPTQDTWEFLVDLDIALTADGLISELRDGTNQLLLTMDGLAITTTEAVIFTSDGLILEAA